jgi:hypothetical protein
MSFSLKNIKILLAALASSVLILTVNSAQAGPFILAGTDADDHGYASAGINYDGWLFMQKVLENLGAGVTNSNQVVAILGSTSSALSAANSAFDNSSLSGAGGWSRTYVPTTSFAGFFNGTDTVNINNAGILMMDSGVNNISGGVDGSAFVPYANDINAFVGAGGGLFSQANGYEWLSALLPSVTVADESYTGISLTAAGHANFPGLTDADLSAGPYHERFENFSPIPSLGISSVTGNTIIIGGTGGSITNPGNTIPEPASLALFSIGLVGMGIYRRRKQVS